jgi:hypothetical protein
LKRGPLYDALTWGATVLVTAVLLALWLDLYVLHAGPELVRQIDRKVIVPKLVVEVIAFSAVGIAVLGVVWRTWRRSAPILVQETTELIRTFPGPDAGSEGGPRSLRRALFRTARETAGGGMSDCEDAQQWVGHLLIMWGFVGLFATTSLDALVNRPADPLPFLHPVRLLGNVTGVMFVAGLTLAMARRGLLASARAASIPADWVLLVTLWGTGVSGFVVQWYADNGDLPGTTWSYIVHLVFVGGILASAPWTKFVHAVWRPTWILYRELVAERRR